MLQDRYGLPVSTTSTAALEAYVEGVDRLLSANAGAEESFDRAIGADPGFALAHIGRARSLQLQAKAADAQAAASRARALAAGATRRERDHVEALAIAVEGDAARALAAIRAHLAEFPRDAMVLGPATGVYGLIGFSGRQDRNEQLAELLDGLAASYGDDWWFLGAHGFALTEARGWAAGAPIIERSLALSPRNAHAAHAHAHVLYERGGDGEGAAFVEAWLASYPRAAQLHCHLSWHLALFELALGRPARAWELYVENIRPGASLSPSMPTLADSASLLWRTELAGERRRASTGRTSPPMRSARSRISASASPTRTARWPSPRPATPRRSIGASQSCGAQMPRDGCSRAAPCPRWRRPSAPSRAETGRRPSVSSPPWSISSCASEAAGPSAISSRTRSSPPTSARAEPRRPRLS